MLWLNWLISLMIGQNYTKVNLIMHLKFLLRLYLNDFTGFYNYLKKEKVFKSIFWKNMHYFLCKVNTSIFPMTISPSCVKIYADEIYKIFLCIKNNIRKTFWIWVKENPTVLSHSLMVQYIKIELWENNIVHFVY